jgi:hypothetical protein
MSYCKHCKTDISLYHYPCGGSVYTVHESVDDEPLEKVEFSGSYDACKKFISGTFTKKQPEIMARNSRLPFIKYHSGRLASYIL